MIPDEELPAAHREALDRVARLKVLLAEMTVLDPARPFTLEDIFKRTLDQVEALVRNHGMVEVIERGKKKIALPGTPEWDLLFGPGREPRVQVIERGEEGIDL